MVMASLHLYDMQTDVGPVSLTKCSKHFIRMEVGVMVVSFSGRGLWSFWDKNNGENMWVLQTEAVRG